MLARVAERLPIETGGAYVCSFHAALIPRAANSDDEMINKYKMAVKMYSARFCCTVSLMTTLIL